MTILTTLTRTTKKKYNGMTILTTLTENIKDILK